MANDKQRPKVDPEVTRRKKEEAARRNRRRTRQLLGLVLTVLMVVGVVSIVNSGIGLVRDLTDDTSEREAYSARVEQLVWFDVLPFTDVNALDDETLLRVAIWGVFSEQSETLEKDEEDDTLIPVLEIDLYLQRLFGNAVFIADHDTFTDVEGINYFYLPEIEAYLMPVTSGVEEYYPTVVNIARGSGGSRVVTVGYVAARDETGSPVWQRDYENPVKYMDFTFRRDGNEYYLETLERNTGYSTPATETTASEAEVSIPVILDDDQAAPEQLPEDDDAIIPPTSSDVGSEPDADPMQGEGAPED